MPKGRATRETSDIKLQIHMSEIKERDGTGKSAEKREEDQAPSKMWVVMIEPISQNDINETK